MSAEGQAYLASLTKTVKEPELPPLPEPSELGLDGFPVTVYGDGSWWLELGDRVENVAAIYLHVCAYDSGLKELYLFGERSDLYADWDNGMFRDEFNGRWGTLDHTYCFMEAMSEGEGYILYRVPVYHNGVYRNLMVLYSWDEPYYYEGSYEILGLVTRSGLRHDATNPEFENLKIGDVVEPALLRLRWVDGHSETTMTQPGDVLTHAITVTKDTRFFDDDLPNGLYIINFLMIDYSAEVHYSDMGNYGIKDGVFYAISDDGEFVTSTR